MNDLSRYLVSQERGRLSWLYRFPNGAEASVIPDLSRPFRFEIASEAYASAGIEIQPGLTTDEVEAALARIAALNAVNDHPEKGGH